MHVHTNVHNNTLINVKSQTRKMIKQYKQNPKKPRIHTP